MEFSKYTVIALAGKYHLKAVCLIVAILLATSGRTDAQGNPIKTIDKSFASKQELKVSHRYGPLTVLPSTDGKINITGKLYGESADPDALESLKQHFEFEVTESSGSLEVVTHFQVRNWNTINGVTKLEFQDGSRISKLRDLQIEAIVYVPNNIKLAVNNKYDEIRIPQGTRGDLAINLYSGRLEVGDVGGRLDIEAKYSKGSIGNFGDGNLDLYDSDLKFGNGKKLSMKTKYSGLELGSFDELIADTYDDNIVWQTIKGELTLTDKYSEFRIGRFNSARMDIYDSEITSDGGNEMLIKSKYTQFKFKEVGQLSFENSYDDKVLVERLGSLSATSKYTEYEIQKLRNKLYLRSYDDELRIGEFSGPFEGIDFEGKYTDLFVNLVDNAEFQLEANLTYGHINYPEGRFESEIYKEKNDRLELKGKTKGAGDSSPKIAIVSYDGKITIE